MTGCLATIQSSEGQLWGYIWPGFKVLTSTSPKGHMTTLQFAFIAVSCNHVVVSPKPAITCNFLQNWTIENLDTLHYSCNWRTDYTCIGKVNRLFVTLSLSLLPSSVSYQGWKSPGFCFAWWPTGFFCYACKQEMVTFSSLIFTSPRVFENILPPIQNSYELTQLNLSSPLWKQYKWVAIILAITNMVHVTVPYIILCPYPIVCAFYPK